MKTPEQITKDKTATREAIDTVSGFRMQHLLALGTGAFVAWTLSSWWSGWASVVIALTTYIIAYPLYVYIEQRRMNIKPSRSQTVSHIAAGIAIVLAIVLYFVNH